MQSKVILITGASSGIGRALARELVKTGAQVCGVARRKDRIEELSQELGGSFLGITGDVTSEAQCQKAVKKCISTFGRLDGLVHAAGITMRGLAAETGNEVYERLIAINYYPLIYLFRHSKEELIKNQGHFAVVSSMQGRFSTQLRSGYAAAKHAAQGWMNSVRIEMIPYNVHFLTVSPGFVNTEISQHAFAADGQKYGKVDDSIAAGLDPHNVARDIISAFKRRKRDIFPAGFKEKFALFMSKFFPSTLDKILSKMKVT